MLNLAEHIGTTDNAIYNPSHSGDVLFLQSKSCCYAPNFENVGSTLVSACPYVRMYVHVCMYVWGIEISP